MKQTEPALPGGFLHIGYLFATEKRARRRVFPDVAFRAKCKMFSRHLQKPILKTEKGRFKGL